MRTVQRKGFCHRQTNSRPTASNDSNETLDIEKVRGFERGHGEGSGRRVEPILLYYVRRSRASGVFSNQDWRTGLSLYIFRENRAGDHSCQSIWYSIKI